MLFRSELEAMRRLEVLLGRYPAAEVMASDNLPTLPSLVGDDGALLALGTPESLLLDRKSVV